MWFYQHVKTVVPWALWGMADRQSSFPSKCGQKNQKSNKRRRKLGKRTGHCLRWIGDKKQYWEKIANHF